MTIRSVPGSGDLQRTSAVRRLAVASERLTQLGALRDAATRLEGEPASPERWSDARARVASRRAWLHWIGEGESTAPWADGRDLGREAAGRRAVAGRRTAPTGELTAEMEASLYDHYGLPYSPTSTTSGRRLAKR